LRELRGFFESDKGVIDVTGHQYFGLREVALAQSPNYGLVLGNRGLSTAIA
jgi:hypothetical protein